MSVRLFVGNLPYNATELELREHFSAVGPVTYLSIPTDRETGQPRGFAFIEFNDRTHAEDAIRRFNNQSFKGRSIAVSEARPRENRPPAKVSDRSSAPRLSLPRPNLNAETDAANPPAPDSKRRRDFGPDASSPSRRKNRRGESRLERVPKGPMREVVRGQFYSGDEDADDLYEEVDDFYEDADDLHEEESSENSFTYRLSDVNDENNN